MTSCNQGLSFNDQRKHKSSLGTRLSSPFPNVHHRAAAISRPSAFVELCLNVNRDLKTRVLYQGTYEPENKILFAISWTSLCTKFSIFCAELFRGYKKKKTEFERII